MLDTEKIANISKLNLREGEREKFEVEFAKILDVVKSMKDVKGNTVPHLLGLTDLRDDVPRQGLSVAEALANAPRKKGRHFVVPQVVD